MRQRPKLLKRSTRPFRRKRLAPDWFLFLSKFLRHGVAISSFLPSSASLSREFLRGIDWDSCRCIVELGAGTGPVTEAILEKAPPTCKTLFIERDPDFCRRLRERFPHADIHEGDAGDLTRILAQRGIRQVDHLLCGLPLPAFPEMLREKVLESAFAHLSEDGSFRQLTHMPYVYQRLFRRYFRSVKFQFVLRNIPPAGYYICRGPRPENLKSQWQ